MRGYCTGYYARLLYSCTAPDYCSFGLEYQPSPAFWAGSGPEEKYQTFVRPRSAQHILGLSPAQPSPIYILYIMYIILCFVLFIYRYI
jgi:hypothetical protein